MPRFLYFPMEIAAREMDSRLLIALHAVRHGFEVIMGQKWVLQKNAARAPQGAWLFKTLMPGDAGPMQRAKDAGHVVCAIDEEVPGLWEGCAELRWVARQAMDNCDLVFCLGEAHKEAMDAKFPEHAQACVVTGNPRWDMLRPALRALHEEAARRLKARFGRFILVNTNSGYTNSAKVSAEKFFEGLFRDGRLDRNRPEDHELVRQLLAFDRANFAAMPEIVRRLSEAFADVHIVLRPHPTERLEPYQQAFAGLENVTVEAGGPVAPWLMACEFLIHTSCTTASEAFALEAPAICFEALETPLNETLFLSPHLSRRTKSVDQLMEWAGDLLAGRREDAWRSPEMLRIFHRFFAAQEGEPAASRIAAAIAERVPEDMARESWRPPLTFRRRRLWRKPFQRMIFPDMPARELQERMDTLARLSGLPAPRIMKIGQAMYHVACAE